MALDLSDAIAAANALPYGTAPFSKGLTAADYRAQHEEHGEPFRYWHAFDIKSVNRDGKTYEEAILGSIGKCRFHTTRSEINVVDFGLLPAGSTMLSCLPEVVEISPGGRLLRTSPQQARTGRATVVRGAGNLDALPRRFVTAITKVSVNGVDVAPSRYEAASANSPNDADVGGVRWLLDAPVAGSKMFVLFRYLPFYRCLGEAMQSEPVGEDGLLLPQRVLLREERD